MTPTVDNEGRYVPPQPPDDPSLRSLSDSLQLLVGTEAGNCARILRPVAALDEVVAISDAVAEGHAPPQPHDRRSLAADVDLALSALGPETKAYLGATVRDYRAHEIPKLEEFLDDGAGAKRVLHASRYLRKKLKNRLATQAAWRDLVSRVRSGRPESDARHAALVLIELAESLGHEWRWVRSRIHDALVAGNLDEVERELGEPPSRTARAAWFAFADAHVPRGYVRLGQVQFFSHEIWPDLVRDESALLKTYPEAEYPRELDDRMTSYMSGVKPGAAQDAPEEEQREAAAAEHRVFARVELTGPRASGAQNPWAHGRPPDKWARDLVVGLVEAASFRWGGSQWKLLEGAVAYDLGRATGRAPPPPAAPRPREDRRDPGKRPCPARATRDRVRRSPQSGRPAEERRHPRRPHDRGGRRVRGAVHRATRRVARQRRP